MELRLAPFADLTNYRVQALLESSIRVVFCVYEVVPEPGAEDQPEPYRNWRPRSDRTEATQSDRGEEF